MKRAILDPTFSVEMNRMAMRYLRAIRAFDALNAHLPIKTPAPSNVKLGKRPYPLEITWRRSSRSDVMSLRAKLNRVLGVPNKWHVDPDTEKVTIVNRTQLRVGEKDTVKVILKIVLGGKDD